MSTERPSAESDARRCCPGAGTMAHTRGCRNHPESPWIAFPGKVPVCQDCGADWRPVRRGECIRCGSDAGPRKLSTDVTEDEGAGSDGHESNEQPAQPVSNRPTVPEVRAQVSDEDRRQPRHGVEGLPVVRLREHDGPAVHDQRVTDRWCPSEFPNAEGRCPACGYKPERLTPRLGMIRTHRTRALPPGGADDAAQ